MSKQRPSNRAPLAAVPAPLAAEPPVSLSYWQRRVFKNTYTRQGELLTVSRWSMKIQHQGIRRTIALAGKTRAAAALEAQAVQARVLSHGWGSALSNPARSRAGPGALAPAAAASDPLDKTDAAYWKPRLVLRKHAAQLTPGDSEYSARIEHAGLSSYFPLGTLDEDAAARKATEIYQTVVQQGWPAVTRRFSREVTVALHWSADPLAWTYLTVHTRVAGPDAEPPRAALRPKAGFTVAIVDSDPGIAQALAKCVNSQVGFACALTCLSVPEALRQLPRRPPQLALVSHSFPDLAGAECREKLRSLLPRLPVIIFSLHEDSDRLFASTPGGSGGYLLKRTSPQLILDPISAILSKDKLTEAHIATQVQQYFQRVVGTLPASSSAPATATLTHREQEVLSLLSKGYLDKEIADSLHISIWTVHGHVKSIFAKLGVHTRTEAAVKYLHK
ncbi:MAG: response regulator transcription factor [Verrucomicrobia bacterium]|nr:response regulator transcription factor [Verrucomicrobiota bacterium]